MKKAKSKRGRKSIPLIKKKVQICVYAPLETIKQNGGMETVKANILKSLGL